MNLYNTRQDLFLSLGCLFCILFFLGSIPLLGQEIELVACDTLSYVIDNDTSCSMSVTELPPEILDSCSSPDFMYSIDLNNDQTPDINGAGAIDLELPLGTHSIQWIASDTCSSDTCQYILSLQDSNAPEIINCFSGIVTIVGEPNEAWHFDAPNQGAIDNCPLDETNYSYSLDSLVKEVEISCPGVHTLTIYAIDNFGNYDSCNMNLYLQDGGLDSCFSVVRGQVIRPEYRPLEDVLVTLEDQFFNVLYSDSTDEDGQYDIQNLDLEQNVILRAFKDDPAWKDVTILDFALIRLHLLGINTFDNIFQFIAADVDRSVSISALDALGIRKILLGIDESWPQAPIWHIWNQELDTSEWLYAPNYVEFNFERDTSFDWWAVKTGDISGSVKDSFYSPQSEVRDRRILTYGIDHFKDATVVEISKSITGLNAILGIIPKNTDIGNFRVVSDHELDVADLGRETRFIVEKGDYINSGLFRIKLEPGLSNTEISTWLMDWRLTGAVGLKEVDLFLENDQEKIDESAQVAFPNPVSKNGVIRIARDDVKLLSLRDATGRLIGLIQGASEIHLTDFDISAGKYLLHIKTNRNETKEWILVE